MASSEQVSPALHSAPGGDLAQGTIPNSLPPPAGADSGASQGVAPRSSSSPTPPQQQQGSSGIVDLFLTAVGLTPRGLGADAFSDGSAAGAEEEDFWTATHEDGRDGAVGRSGGGDAGYGGQVLHLQSSPPRQQQGRSVEGTVATTGIMMEAPEAARDIFQPPPAAADRDTPYNRTQQEGLSEMQRYPAEEASSQQRQTTQPATLAEGTARRRRRLFGSNGAGAAALDTDSSIPRSRTSSGTTPRLLSRGNPLFRSRDGGSFWRPSTVAGSATFDDEEDEEDNAARAGARAVERVVNGPSMAIAPPDAATGATAAVSGVEVNSGSRSGEAGPSQVHGDGGVDASERGEGGGGGGGGESSASREGRILFYHKPTLANVPAGDVPDVVPVYLGCPRGNMALGLPLNEAWQGEEHQDTTFNQNLSYTILSWPEEHVQDLLELWRLQVLFFATIIFNILLSAVLYFSENPDRTRVEGFARAGAFPGPFQQRSPLDDPTGLSSENWHLAAALLLSLMGIACVLARLPAGIMLYLVLTVVNAVVGLSHSPDPLFACRYGVDVVLVALGRSYLSSLTYTWVTASAGGGRWGW